MCNFILDWTFDNGMTYEDTVLIATQVSDSTEIKDDDQDKIDEVYKTYKATVNMSASELKTWKGNECSSKAGLDKSPIDRNIRLLSKKKSDWTASDAKSANRTISFVSRMKGNSSGEKIKGCGLSKRDISLKNWAYNPRK